MKRKHRPKIVILYDILKTIREHDGATVSEIILHANIPHDRLKKILNSLLEKRIIERINRRGRILYVLTVEGYKLFCELEKIKRILDSLGLY